jgi:hypothetical protein
MNVSRLSDLNDSPQNKILKQILSIGDQHIVVIDKTIIQKIGIEDNDTIFLEQEFREEDSSIFMKIKKMNLKEIKSTI